MVDIDNMIAYKYGSRKVFKLVKTLTNDRRRSRRSSHKTSGYDFIINKQYHTFARDAGEFAKLWYHFYNNKTYPSLSKVLDGLELFVCFMVSNLKLQN